MPKPYSYDLRQKVINAIVLNGMKKTEVAQVFQISRNTINLWLQRQAETGDYQPKPTRPQRTNAKIPDWQEFSQFAQMHGDKTQAQMAQLWSGEISPRTISRGLKKIGWTREKRRRCLKKAEGRRGKSEGNSTPPDLEPMNFVSGVWVSSEQKTGISVITWIIQKYVNAETLFNR